MSEVVTSYSRTRTASKKTFLFVFCICFFILCGIAIGCFVGLFQAKHCQQMIADGKTATAEIYNCYQDSGLGPNAWRCAYKYIDENGTEYSATLAMSYKTREEGEKYIGEKIEIYIDGKGGSLPVGEDPNIGYAETWVIISVILVFADTVGIIVTSVKIHRNKQKQA